MGHSLLCCPGVGGVTAEVSDPIVKYHEQASMANLLREIKRLARFVRTTGRAGCFEWVGGMLQEARVGWEFDRLPFVFCVSFGDATGNKRRGPEVEGSACGGGDFYP